MPGLSQSHHQHTPTHLLLQVQQQWSCTKCISAAIIDLRDGNYCIKSRCCQNTDSFVFHLLGVPGAPVQLFAGSLHIQWECGCGSSSLLGVLHICCCNGSFSAFAWMPRGRSDTWSLLPPWFRKISVSKGITSISLEEILWPFYSLCCTGRKHSPPVEDSTKLTENAF